MIALLIILSILLWLQYTDRWHLWCECCGTTLFHQHDDACQTKLSDPAKVQITLSLCRRSKFGKTTSAGPKAKPQAMNNSAGLK